MSKLSSDWKPEEYDIMLEQHINSLSKGYSVKKKTLYKAYNTFIKKLYVYQSDDRLTINDRKQLLVDEFYITIIQALNRYRKSSEDLEFIYWFEDYMDSSYLVNRSRSPWRATMQ